MESQLFFRGNTLVEGVPFEYKNGNFPHGYGCSRCGKEKLKLWRNQHSGQLFCLRCAMKNQGIKCLYSKKCVCIGSLIPAIPASINHFYAFRSALEAEFRWWEALPDQPIQTNSVETQSIPESQQLSVAS